MPQVWLVTSASSGFGLELVNVVARKGDRVLAASQNPEKLASLASNNMKPVRLDHNGPLEQIQSAIHDILAIYGIVDIVVNNAAYVQTGILEEVSPEDILRQVPNKHSWPAQPLPCSPTISSRKGHRNSRHYRLYGSMVSHGWLQLVQRI